MKRIVAVVVLTAIYSLVPTAPASGASRPGPPARAEGAGRKPPDPVPCQDCWSPDLQTSLQWQLSGELDTSVDAQVYDIDLFDRSKSVVSDLHSQGRMVVCYMSAGSLERWREDAKSFPRSVIGSKLDGWAGERWLDVRKRRLLKPIMQGRVDMCSENGFDGIEFDNVDAWSARTGFSISKKDQLKYNVMLANMAHRAGLAAAMKNDVEQVKELLPYFDMHLDEECFRYKECDRLLPFVDAGKPVFEVEYEAKLSEFCPDANAMNFNAMRKRPNLGAWRKPCR